MTFRLGIPRRITDEDLIKLSIIFYFIKDIIYSFLYFFIRNNSITWALVIVIIYAPLLAACVTNPRKFIKPDAILLYIGIIGFFLITLMIHPEYKASYLSQDYGVWNHVLIPYRGIYAYLFVRLLDEPVDLKKCLKTAGWMMFVYFFYRYFKYLERGYWVGIGMYSAGSVKLSYSVEFGYEILPFALLFLYDAIKEKKPADILATATDIMLIFIAGSRGPVLFIGVFVVLYLLIELKKSRNKLAIIFGTVVMLGIIYAIYPFLLNSAINFFDKIGVSSRFLTMLQSGTISSDSGRGIIWNAALQMIRQNPLGYGFMGSRHIISKYIIAGYPHSFVLEFLIDFGVVFGSLLLIVMFYFFIRMLFKNDNEVSRGLFLVYFSAVCSLFISLTFWSTPTLWICLGLTVSQIKKNTVSFRLKKA